MKFVYVFDYREKTGYLCRVPEFIAKIICKHLGFHDYDYTLPTD
jgi:hypothetical protein